MRFLKYLISFDLQLLQVVACRLSERRVACTDTCCCVSVVIAAKYLALILVWLLGSV